MAHRATSYLSKPSEVWKENKEVLNSMTILLVSRPGPTVFQLQDEAGKTFRVMLGNPHTCSCCGKASSSDICIHMLYCLLKVLRIPDTHPLSWQTSFTDAETDQVLQGLGNHERTVRRTVARLLRKPSNHLEKQSDGSADENAVKRQVMEDGEFCPICQDEMTNDQALTWCRSGCGNNMHAKCMQSYAQFKKSQSKDPVQCPLCREEWCLSVLAEDCRGKSSLKNTCAPVKCFVCTISQRNVFYRCLECSTKSGKPVDICPGCFTTSSLPTIHATHHFLSSDASVLSLEELTWTPATNPKAPPRVLDTAVLEQLQSRELRTEDYDMLLSLDRAGPPPLPVHIFESLEEISSTESGLSCYCWCRTSSELLERTDRRRLCCGHCVHRSCLEEAIQKILSVGEWALGTHLRCQHEGCQRRLQPGLNRKRKVVKPEKQPKAADSPQVPTDESARRQNSLHFGLNGTSLGGPNSSVCVGNDVNLIPTQPLLSSDRNLQGHASAVTWRSLSIGSRHGSSIVVPTASASSSIGLGGVGKLRTGRTVSSKSQTAIRSERNNSQEFSADLVGIGFCCAGIENNMSEFDADSFRFASQHNALKPESQRRIPRANSTAKSLQPEYSTESLAGQLSSMFDDSAREIKIVRPVGVLVKGRAGFQELISKKSDRAQAKINSSTTLPSIRRSPLLSLQATGLRHGENALEIGAEAAFSQSTLRPSRSKFLGGGGCLNKLAPIVVRPRSGLYSIHEAGSSVYNETGVPLQLNAVPYSAPASLNIVHGQLLPRDCT